MPYIKSHSNYVLRTKHKSINNGTVFERDMTTIGGINNFAPGQTPIYKSGNFLITVNSDMNASKLYSSSDWEKNPEGEIWTVDNISYESKDKTDSNDSQIEVKQDYYDLRDYAYFGSCSELIRGSISDILNRFPGELHNSYEKKTVYQLEYTVPAEYSFVRNFISYEGGYIVKKDDYNEWISNGKVSALNYSKDVLEISKDELKKLDSFYVLNRNLKIVNSGLTKDNAFSLTEKSENLSELKDLLKSDNVSFKDGDIIKGSSYTTILDFDTEEQLNKEYDKYSAYTRNILVKKDVGGGTTVPYTLSFPSNISAKSNYYIGQRLKKDKDGHYIIYSGDNGNYVELDEKLTNNGIYEIENPFNIDIYDKYITKEESDLNPLKYFANDGYKNYEAIDESGNTHDFVYCPINDGDSYVKNVNVTSTTVSDWIDTDLLDSNGVTAPLNINFTWSGSSNGHVYEKLGFARLRYDSSVSKWVGSDLSEFIKSVEKDNIVYTDSGFTIDSVELDPCVGDCIGKICFIPLNKGYFIYTEANSTDKYGKTVKNQLILPSFSDESDAHVESSFDVYSYYGVNDIASAGTINAWAVDNFSHINPITLDPGSSVGNIDLKFNVESSEFPNEVDADYSCVASAGQCIYVYVGNEGKKVYMTDSSFTYSIRPKNNFYEEFIESLDSFEKLLLNTKSDPKYTAKFKIVDENEYGYFTTEETFTFPTGHGGYNLGTEGAAYDLYINRLSKIGEFYDERFSDNMYRSMTHESIKNFDWSYNKLSDTEETQYQETAEKVSKIIRLYGREFDEVKTYIDAIANVNTVTYDDVDNLPDYFFSDELEDEGWDLRSVVPYSLYEYVGDNQFAANIAEQVTSEERSADTYNDYSINRIFNRDNELVITPYSNENEAIYPNGYFYGHRTNGDEIGKISGEVTTAKTLLDCANHTLNLIKHYSTDREYSMSDVNIEFMKRLILNSSDIWKHKGTLDSIEMILGMFGMRSKRWYDSLTTTEQQTYATNYCTKYSGKTIASGSVCVPYDFDIKEYTLFTEKIADPWLPAADMFKYDYYNSKKTIRYDTQDYLDGIYNAYQGLPVVYRESNSAYTVSGEVETTPVRYIYPSFNKEGIYDGNPYYQMNGGWMQKRPFMLDKDEHIVHRKEEDIFSETLRGIKQLSTLKDLIYYPYGNLENGDIVYVTDLTGQYAIIDGMIYDLYDYVDEDGNIYQYITVTPTNSYVTVGNAFFDDFIVVSTPFSYDGTERYDLTNGLNDGKEIRIFVMYGDVSRGTIKCYSDTTSVSNFSLFIGGQAYGVDYSGASVTNYFRINNVYYSDEISIRGWQQLLDTDYDYYRVNSILDYYEGNNPHTGHMHYDNGHEYLEYFKQLFKYAYENEYFDYEHMSVFGDDSMYDDMGNFGFKYLISNDNCNKQYSQFLTEDSKIHYFGDHFTYSRDTYDDMVDSLYGSNHEYIYSGESAVTISRPITSYTYQNNSEFNGYVKANRDNLEIIDELPEWQNAYFDNIENGKTYWLTVGNYTENKTEHPIYNEYVANKDGYIYLGKITQNDSQNRINLGYNTSTVSPIIGGNSYYGSKLSSGASIDGVTNQIMNTKCTDITFYLRTPDYYSKEGIEEIKYIDNVILNYLTQLLPSTSINKVEYVYHGMSSFTYTVITDSSEDEGADVFFDGEKVGVIENGICIVTKPFSITENMDLEETINNMKYKVTVGLPSNSAATLQLSSYYETVDYNKNVFRIGVNTSYEAYEHYYYSNREDINNTSAGTEGIVIEPNGTVYVNREITSSLEGEHALPESGTLDWITYEIHTQTNDEIEEEGDTDSTDTDEDELDSYDYQIQITADTNSTLYERDASLSLEYKGVSATCMITQESNSSKVTYTIATVEGHISDEALIYFYEDADLTKSVSDVQGVHFTNGYYTYTRNEVGASDVYYVKVVGGLDEGGTTYEIGAEEGYSLYAAISPTGETSYDPHIKATIGISEYTYDITGKKVVTTGQTSIGKNSISYIEASRHYDSTEVKCRMEANSVTWVTWNPDDTVSGSDEFNVSRNGSESTRKCTVRFYNTANEDVYVDYSISQFVGEYEFYFNDASDSVYTYYNENSAKTVIDSTTDVSNIFGKVHSQFNGEDVGFAVYEYSYISDTINNTNWLTGNVKSDYSIGFNKKRNCINDSRSCIVTLRQEGSGKRINLLVEQERVIPVLGDTYMSFYNGSKYYYAFCNVALSDERSTCSKFTPIGIYFMMPITGTTASKCYKIVSLNQLASNAPINGEAYNKSGSEIDNDTEHTKIALVNQSLIQNEKTSTLWDDDNVLAYLPISGSSKYTSHDKHYTNPVSERMFTKTYYGTYGKETEGSIDLPNKVVNSRITLLPYKIAGRSAWSTAGNPIFFNIAKGLSGTTENVLSDFDGFNNTKKYYNYKTYNNGEIDRNNSTHVLWKNLAEYTTVGTTQRQWFMGAVGEWHVLIYQLKMIEDNLSLIQDKYSLKVDYLISSKIPSDGVWGGSFWTSTYGGRVHKNKEFGSWRACTNTGELRGLNHRIHSSGHRPKYSMVRPLLNVDYDSLTPKDTY